MADSGDTVRWDLDWEGEAPPAAPPPAPTPPAATVEPPPPPPEATIPAPRPTPLPVEVPPPITPPAVPKILVRGQRLRLAAWSPVPAALELVFSLPAPTGLALDLCCFGLDTADRLSDDRYFIFYNQKSSPEGALSLDGTVFRAALDRLPAQVRRLAFTATVDGPGSVRALGDCLCEFRRATGETLAGFPFAGRELDEVAALIIAEIYRKDDDTDWRVSATAQGFAGGLSALLKHYGGSEH